MSIAKIDPEAKKKFFENIITELTQKFDPSFTLSQIQKILFEECVQEIKKSWKEKKPFTNLTEQERIFNIHAKEFVWSQITEKKYSSTGALIHRIPTITLTEIEKYVPPRKFVEEAMKR